EDPEETVPGVVESSRPVDAEAGADVRRDEPPVESFAERRRQPVQFLERAELERGAVSVRQPSIPSPSGAGGDDPRAVPAGCRSQRARARARSSGVLRFMKARSGSACCATASVETRSTRTSSKKPTTLSWPARSRGARAGRHALP